jgi:uncharacterized membrane protein
MDVSTFNASFTRVELFSLVAVAVVVGVVLGPGAITLEGTDSMWVEALSAVLVAMLVFVVGALSLWTTKQ